MSPAGGRAGKARYGSSLRYQYDEDDVRVRPSRRGSRPRTKIRPAHADAVPGRVLGIDRGRYTVLLDAPSKASSTTSDDRRRVTAMKARELGRKSIVVGDRVALVGDTSGDPDTLARIVRQLPRTSVLRRTADDTDPTERVIVANADQLVIVTALADPPPRPRMIDRCLVAAYDAGLDPLLALTKADLADPQPLLEAYGALAVPAVVTSLTGSRDDRSDSTDDSPDHCVDDSTDDSPDHCANDASDTPTYRRPEAQVDGLTALHELLAGRVSVFVGHSGVGKSTLVNALVPDAQRSVGHVNVVTGRGRHTSTSVVALELPGPAGGWVIDTPGVRSFGLAHVDPHRIVELFPDLVGGTAHCPRGCTHDEPECGLDDWVRTGAAGPAGTARLDSVRRLLQARAPGD